MTTEPTTTAAPADRSSIMPDSEAPPTARRMRRRRRPSGTAPPLPRSIGTTGTGWLVASAALLTWGIVAYNSAAARRATDRVDAAVLRQFARLRTEWLTDIASPIGRIGMGWAVPIATAAALILALMVLKRWRHVFTFVGSLAVAELAVSIVYQGFARPRPYDVTIIGRWRSFSLPRRARGLRGLRRHRDHLRARGRGPAANDREDPRRPRSSRSSSRLPAVPRHVPPLRRPRRSRPRDRVRDQRVPVLHTERGLPGHVRRRQDRAPRRRRPAR